MGSPRSVGRQGLSAEDWARHKPLIKTLYLGQNQKLKDVRAFMKQTHRFDATDRQYQEKFRQWEFKKNITDTVRRQYNEQSKQGPVHLNPDEKRRLARHMKDPKKRQALAPGVREGVLAQTPTPAQATAINGSQLLSLDFPATLNWREGMPAHSSTSQTSGPCSPTPDELLSISDRLSHSNFGLLSDLSITMSRDGPHMTPSRLHEGWTQVHDPSHKFYYEPPSRPPSRPLRAPHDMSERLFSELYYFCSPRRSNVPVFNSSFVHPTETIDSKEVKKHTSDLKDLVYLYKINDTDTADKAVMEYCSLPFRSVIDLSVQFLVDMIATLAPINTTRPAASQARIQILTHFLKLCRETLDEIHPFTIICDMLLKAGPCDETSRRSLRVLQNAVASWSFAMFFKIDLLAIATLRREKNFTDAAARTSALVANVTTKSGPDSLEARKSKSELAYIHMAQENYEAAISLCREVESFVPCDTLAVRARENLAEIHRLRGEHRISNIWLEAAASGATEVWGASVATSHIMTKLFDAWKEANDEEAKERAEIYRKKYQAYL